MVASNYCADREIKDSQERSVNKARAILVSTYYIFGMRESLIWSNYRPTGTHVTRTRNYVKTQHATATLEFT